MLTTCCCLKQIVWPFGAKFGLNCGNLPPHSCHLLWSVLKRRQHTLCLLSAAVCWTQKTLNVIRKRTMGLCIFTNHWVITRDSFHNNHNGILATGTCWIGGMDWMTAPPPNQTDGKSSGLIGVEGLFIVEGGEYIGWLGGTESLLPPIFSSWFLRTSFSNVREFKPTQLGTPAWLIAFGAKLS